MRAEPRLDCSSPFVALPMAELRAFCDRWEVEHLKLVGSAVRGPFRPASDLDFVYYASFRARINAPGGGARKEAFTELHDLTGREVELICSRQTLASGNPYAAYNLLVEDRFSRDTGLLWYLNQAFSVLARLPDAAHALGDPRARPHVLGALVRLARTCDRDERTEGWRTRGLSGIPFERVGALVGPVLRAVRAMDVVTWPNDTELVALIDALRPFAPAVSTLARELPSAPALPPEIVARAIGDLPRAPAPGAPLPSPDEPSLLLDGREDRGEILRSACRRWGIFRLIEERGDDVPVPRRFVAFASVHAPLYRAPGILAEEALSDFAALGGQLTCARRAVLTGPPRAVYNLFVRRAFAPDELVAADAPVPAGLVAEAIADMPPADRERWR